MSLAADSGLTASPSPGSVRSLQALPEVLSPVRHGFLWKRSRAFKSWLSRWFQLDDTGFTYAVSPKLIKREGRYVLPSAVREVLPLPPERYRNGATMYGVRVVATSGATKDLYTDDAAALEAWTRDLARSTPAARQAAYRKALMAAPPAGALPLPPSRRPGGAALLNELHLGDICEVDWSGMLGSGLFACVLRGRLHEGGEAVAVKIIKKEAMIEYSEIVYREAQVWSAVGVHPHICQLKQVLRSSARMYFIAELCDGGGLVERLAASATYCEREVAWLMRQLLAAVAHLHQNAIVHMDIKPENVVFATRREDSLIKLIDFSLAAFVYTPTDPGGTPDFVAPELLNAPDVVSKNGCGPEVDMWALGVMLFFLLSGQTPFQSANLETVMMRVKSGEWNFHGRRWALVSEGARDLVSRLLKREPSQRLTAEEALQHPWLNRPEALSQALLQDAISSFRAAAAAQQRQMRTSWIKQGSGDLTGCHATGTGTGIPALHSNHLSPRASLNRQAMMQAMAGSSNGPPAAALMSTGGLVRNLMSTHPGLDPAAVMSALGSDRPGSPLIRNSPSQSVMLTGGPSGRGSRATGHNSNSPSMPAAVAAAAAAAAAAGARGGSRNNSFSVGGGGPANMSRMGAGGLASGPMPAGGVGSTTLTAALAVARGSGGGSPHPSPHHSPHHSGTGTAGGAGCSPRSPLGMRTRRASDTMAYTISLTERQESFTQMQAQGLAAPPNAGMQWPAAMALNSSKARRASDVLSYGLMPYNSASQADLGSAAATAGLTSAADAGSSVGAAGGAGGHSSPGLPPASAGSSFGLRGSQQRGASGLSIMTNASTSAAAAAAAAAAMRAGGRSNPELLSNRHATSSAGAQSNNGSSSELAPPISSRDADTAPGQAALLAAMTGVGSSSSRGGGNAGLMPPPSQSQVHLQSSPSAPAPQAPPPPGEKKYDAGGGDRGLSRNSLSNAQARFAKLAGSKSQSFHAIPSDWVMDAQAPPTANVGPRSGAHGDGNVGGSLGSVHPAMAAVLTGAGGGGSARGAGASGAPGGGGGGVGAVPLVALQRRASMSFTAGTSGSGLAGPHGPSPLSNSSAGRIFPPDTLVAAAGASSSMHGAGSRPPSGTAAYTAGAGGGGGGGSGAGGGVPTLARQLSRPVSGASTPLAPSPIHSQSNVPFQAFSSGGGGSGAGGVPGASGAPGSTSMYAAVLRANLSGHALTSTSGAESGGGGGALGGGGGSRRATATGAGSGASTPRSCGSPSGSGTQPHTADAGGPTVSQATAAVADGSMMRTTSSGSLSGAAMMQPRSLRGMAGSGMAGAAAVGSGSGAPGTASLRADSGGNTQKLMEQVVLGPLLRSSSSNVGVTGSSAAGGGGGGDQASASGSGSVVGASSGAPSGAREHASGGVPGSGASGAAVGTAVAVLLADGSSALRPTAWSNDTAGGSNRRRAGTEPSLGVARAGAASADDGGSGSAADGLQPPRFSSGPQASVADAGGGSGSGGNGSSSGDAAGGGARAAPPIADALRGNALGRRASSRLALETIPSEDPESLSGLIRSVREERVGAGGAGGGLGGTSLGGTSSSSNRGGIAAHAALVLAANLPSGAMGSTGIDVGPVSGPEGGDTRGAECGGGALASLIHLPSTASETTDEMMPSLRSGMATLDPAAGLRSGPAADLAAAALCVAPPQPPLGVPSRAREPPVSHAPPVRAATGSSGSGSALHRATSALGASSLHSGGSLISGPTPGSGGLMSAPHRSASLNDEAMRVSEAGDRSSGGSGHSNFGRHSQGSANGASPLGSPVGGRGSGANSGGSGRQSVRRATTAVNLRLHATTAAAAQAAAAAEKAALAAEHVDASTATGVRAPHSPTAVVRAPHSPIPGSSPRAGASKPPATKTVKEENSSSSESGSDGKAEPDTEGKPDPFAHWDWPPPAPVPLAPRAPGSAGHRQRAASAMGLSGASLAALLAQAAPLAQAAQASAAAQIECIYSSSGGGSFTSQRGHGPPGSIRAAGLLAGFGHGSDLGAGTGSGGPGTPHYPVDDGSAGASGGPRLLGSGNGNPTRGVRRAATSSSMGTLVCTAADGIAPAVDEDMRFAQNATAAALRGAGVPGGGGGGGGMSQVVMATTTGGGFAGSGVGGSSRMAGGGGTSLHGQVSMPAAVAAGSVSGAESPVQPLKTRTSAAAGGAGGTLAALLAQAAPLAAAAQANAAAQTAARIASNSSTASITPAAVPYGVRAAAGSGPSTPTGHNTLAVPGGGGNAYFGSASGQGPAGVGSSSGASAGSAEQPGGVGSWARRRSSTSRDLRDRTAASYLAAGGSAVHRLGQNPAGVFAAALAAGGGGSSGGTGTGMGVAMGASMGTSLALAGGSSSGVPDTRGVWLTGGAVGGVQPRLSQSPPREQGSPGGASMSSAGRLSTYPAVPSRLSHSGTGTNTPRLAGVPGGAAASTAGAVAGASGSGVLIGVQSPVLSPQSSLNRMNTGASSSSAAVGHAAANIGGGTSSSGAASLLPHSLSLPANSAATAQAAAAAQIAQLTQLHHLQNQLHQQSQLRVRTSSRSGSSSAFAPAPTGGAVSATGLGVGVGVGALRLNGDRLRGRGTSSGGGVSPSHSAMQLGGAFGTSGSGGAAAIPALDKDKLIEDMEREIQTLHGQLGAARRSNASPPRHSRMSGGGSAQQLRTRQ